MRSLDASSKKFPKSARILSSSHYKYLNRNGLRIFGSQIALNVLEGRAKRPRLGITVSRKYGKAHERNRFKRVIREAFRELAPLFPENLELNVSPRASQELLSKQAILVELKHLIGRFSA